MRGFTSPATWSRKTKVIVGIAVGAFVVVVTAIVVLLLYVKDAKDDFEETFSPGVLVLINRTSETLLLHEYPFGDGPGFGNTGVFLVPAQQTVRAQCGGGLSDQVLGDQTGKLIYGFDVHCPSGGGTRRVVIEEADIVNRSAPPYPAPTAVTPQNAIPEAK